jgi:protein O-mannosyl-transferase
MIEDKKQNRMLLLICAGLVLATVIAYEPVRHNELVNYDDRTYITENPNITAGITLHSIIWAFTSSYSANWHPLTWLSHMMDYQLYGLKPLGHHVTNLIIHIANTLLLFLILKQMTAAMWKSAFVAAAFALHPVHVESVAWAAERKDVLSTFFWMLTILAYVHYVKKPNIKSYLFVILAFALGLMSKPMLVTLPFVLVLLDYWPLDRFENFKSSFYKLIHEKIPLFAMSAGSCIITFIVQKRGGAVSDLTGWPWHARILNGLGSYFNYIVKILYPTKLAVLYPFEGTLSIQAALAAILGASLLLYYWGRGRRWLVIGLLWYLGTLVPVIGIVQIGEQMMADRYTYIPSIGVFIIIAWGAEEIFLSKHFPKIVPAAVSAAAIAAMILITRVQTGYWKDTPTLFKQAIAVTKNNYTMLNDYGAYLCMQGNYEEGLKYSAEALKMRPDFLPARTNLCAGLLHEKKYDEAIIVINETLQMVGEWPEAYKLYYSLGLAYANKGNLDLAEINLTKSAALRPDFAPARHYLSIVQAQKKQKTTGK